MLKLEFPNESHKEAFEKFIVGWEDWKKAPSTVFEIDNFEDFLDVAKKDIIWVEWKVPAHIFFLIDDEIEHEILWAIQVRHHINHPNLIEDWGHIWYWVNPKFRWKWYWTKLLNLGLEKVKELWLDIEKLSITCDIVNIWSNKIIKNNWWVFDKKVNDWTKNKYWIDLK